VVHKLETQTMIAGCLMSEANDQSERSGFTVSRTWQQSYFVLQWASTIRFFTRTRQPWVCLCFIAARRYA